MDGQEGRCIKEMRICSCNYYFQSQIYYCTVFFDIISWPVILVRFLYTVDSFPWIWSLLPSSSQSTTLTPALIKSLILPVFTQHTFSFINHSFNFPSTAFPALSPTPQTQIPIFVSITQSNHPIHSKVKVKIRLKIKFAHQTNPGHGSIKLYFYGDFFISWTGQEPLRILGNNNGRYLKGFLCLWGSTNWVWENSVVLLDTLYFNVGLLLYCSLSIKSGQI